jgi:mannose-6-phosphate isomerase
MEGGDRGLRELASTGHGGSTNDQSLAARGSTVPGSDRSIDFSACNAMRCSRDKHFREQESTITVEHAGTQIVRKPWGSKTLVPWSAIDPQGEAVGELWFQRANTTAPDPALLLKLLFANEKLSVQVHPDDGFARSIGLPHGKTEAWYIVSATPDAEVAVGLSQSITTHQLQTSIEDGSIASLMSWRHVQAGDVIFVPAGTIHAIGPGVVIAEIQQNSDATFRVFDYGRQRELHVANAVAVARTEAAGAQVAVRRLTDARTLLVACPYFVLERINLAPASRWDIAVTAETWVLALEGEARFGAVSVSAGEALFLEHDRAVIETGSSGLCAVVAYVASEPRTDLLTMRSPNHSKVRS